MVKLKTKITLTKIKKIKEWGSNWKKKHKLWLTDEIKNR